MKVRWLFEYIHLTFTSSAFGGNGIYLNYSTKMALPDEGQGHEVEPWAMEHGQSLCPSRRGRGIRGTGERWLAAVLFICSTHFPFIPPPGPKEFFLFWSCSSLAGCHGCLLTISVCPYETYCAFVLPMEDSECLHIAIMIELHLPMYSHALKVLICCCTVYTFLLIFEHV